MQIAIIPARGGSKRIPRKNVIPFAGRSMIGWPIAAALEAGVFDEVIVSTDDAEIADVARAAGASVPFMRPAELSDDMSPARGVINHAILDAEKRHGQTVEMVCTVYATAAFATAADLLQARAALMQDESKHFAFAAAEYAHPVQRAMTRAKDGGVEMLFPEHRSTRTQDLPEAFHDVGMFYWGKRDAFVSEQPMFSPQSLPFLMPRERAVDIDTPDDWSLAEALFEVLRSKGSLG